MIEEPNISEGARWISVVPKGYGEMAGDFLSTIGLGSPDKLALALVALVFVSWLVLQLGDRMGGRSNARGATLPKGAGGFSGPTRGRSADAAEPIHETLQSIRRGRDRVAAPGTRAREAARCAWQQAGAADATGLARWVCTVCGQIAEAPGGRPPQVCLRA